ncbi:MAG TPA: DEAD/DEAH box helicase [Dehalococcoidia bacterium]|jgi:DEAD/DEAH box helicase domain-containing protein|nr:DEAD/DEAH box helicase [Dehalococcoidia bacterium]
MPSAFLQHLTGLASYRGQMVHVESLPPREAKYGSLEEPLHPALQGRLGELGICRLYSHQAQAVNLARQGHHVMVTTPSASGKTLCYNLSVVECLLSERGSRALYLFPTKALAQDQLRVLGELVTPGLLDPGEYATFDGDTPLPQRSEIKRRARIVLTNPDMLHLGILPNHASWSRLLRRLRYVVVDEAHTYRGVFGSHVANVLRRLRRLCAAYGSSPQFICCSATIANPEEHAARLVGLPFQVVAEDGSPHGGRDFVFWNPPLLDAAKSARRSANSEATALFTELVQQGKRSLAFARSRKLAELIYIYSRERLAEEAPGLVERIMPYRAGYLPEERRRIEQELFGGWLLGVVATTALELGVDIGQLEATILTGYPGSIASTWQQAGRSGRGQDRALSFLVALDNPLDQYFMRHPEAFFGKSFENALINLENPYILKPHLLCAAWELPLTAADESLFGQASAQVRGELEREGRLREKGGRWYPSTGIAYPAQQVNIRSTSGEQYSLVDEANGELLETIEASVAFFQVHPGAIYLHQGESYLVTYLDLVSRTAYARPADVNYYTQTKDLTDVHILKKLREKEAGPVRVYLGEVEVTTEVVGFKKKAQFTEEVIGEEPLDLPPQRFPTVALWFDLPPEAMARLPEEGLDVAGGLHAAEHAAIALLPLFALCDRNDIGGVSTPLHPDTGKPQVFIYDAHPGGVGIAEKGYELIEALWEATLKAISECPCEAGCPSCVQSPKCGNNNEPLDKGAAVALLQGLVGGPVAQ